MAYTNPWSDTVPLGTANANTIDDIIRQLRLDIHERMNAVVQDWEADPVVLLSAVGTGIHGVGYDQDAIAGSKALSYTPIVTLLCVSYKGTAPGGLAVINFNEINTLTGTTNYQVSNLYNPHTTAIAPDTFILPLAFIGRSPDDGNHSIAVKGVFVNLPANTISLDLQGIDAGDRVRFFAIFGFITLP